MDPELGVTMLVRVRQVAVGVLLLVLASLLSLYSYGRFASRAQGPVSHAIPAQGVDTPIDRAVVPLTDAHGDQSGLVLLTDNLDAFALRAATARGAGRSLDLQYYIWEPDFTGNLLAYELLRAADRGVRVRLLLDDLNAHGRSSVLASLDSHPHIEVRLFNPTRSREGSMARAVEGLLRLVSLNRRMHNKAWIVDGRIAVVGGRNIGDAYFDAAADANFVDADVAVVGPPVAQTAAIFDDFWNSVSAIPLAALAQAEPGALDAFRRNGDAGHRSPRAHPYLERVETSTGVRQLLHGERTPHWVGGVQVYSDPPGKAAGEPRKGWLMDVLEPAMDSARHELRLISPYFLPGEDGLAMFSRARARGVEVGVLTNSLAANDVLAVHGGYADYRVPLLELGVALYELMPHGMPGHGGSGSGSGGGSGGLFGSSTASLHTKAFMVDGRTAFVGSFNLDPRSINLNTEMGILFQDPGLAAELLRSYEEGVAHSYRLHLQAGALRWEDGSVDPPRQWDREPEASLWRRGLAWIVSWLPIESQL